MQQQNFDSNKYLSTLPKLFVFLVSIVSAAVLVTLLSFSGWSIPTSIYILVGIVGYQLGGIHANTSYTLALNLSVLKVLVDTADKYLSNSDKK